MCLEPILTQQPWCSTFRLYSTKWSLSRTCTFNSAILTNKSALKQGPGKSSQIKPSIGDNSRRLASSKPRFKLLRNKLKKIWVKSQLANATPPSKCKKIIRAWPSKGWQTRCKSHLWSDYRPVCVERGFPRKAASATQRLPR